MPLRGAVVLPMTVPPLGVSRPVSVEAVNRALAGDRMVLLLLQKNDNDDPGADDLHRVGTVAIIRQMAKGQGGMRVLVEGVARARAEFLQTEKGYLTRADQGRCRSRPSGRSRSTRTCGGCRSSSTARCRSRPASRRTSGRWSRSLDDPLRIAYLLASLLDMKPEDKQRLLEENSVAIKLDAVATRARARDRRPRAEGPDRVARREGDDRRAAAVRAAPAAEGDPVRARRGRTARAQELRKRIAEANLPEHVAAVANREVDRLERMTPAAPEYQMIRTYLDWLLEVPWAKRTDDRLDPVEARRVLDEDHYDLDKVKERIVEYLAVRKLKGDMKGPILCFVGPPGVGKTSLGQSIARAMNRKFVRISLGGVRDEAEIRGHRRTYIGSMPGRLVQALKTGRLDRTPSSCSTRSTRCRVGIQGDPAAALLEVLDPAQNHSFRDHYLEVPIDLSNVLFIATANQLGDDPSGAARPHGDHPAQRLHRRGEGPHREDATCAAAARGARPARRSS